MKSIACVLGALLLTGCATVKDYTQGKKVWEEHFNGKKINESNWTKIPRGTSDWQNQMSSDDRLYDVRKGKLVLKGMKNTILPQDTAKTLTGGVYTKDKVAFGFGRWEVRAKLNGATGAWPAFWLLPQVKDRKWPNDGEIDIMERLSHDDFVYQTVHSYYTVRLGKGDTPPHSATAKINPADFNVYAAEVHPDEVILFVNGKKTLSYPRIETTDEGQFPYADHPFYLLLDMQLGGSWVGKVNYDELPVEMEIDWVKFYEFKP